MHQFGVVLLAVLFQPQSSLARSFWPATLFGLECRGHQSRWGWGSRWLYDAPQRTLPLAFRLPKAYNSGRQEALWER